MKNTRKVLRARLSEGTPVVVPGAYSALTVMILQEAGFEAAYISGDHLSAAALGLPNVGFLGLSEMTQNAKRIADAVDIPLIADAGMGFGNAVNAAHTVREYIHAGAAAIHLGDRIPLEWSGNAQATRLLPLDEAVLKVRAASETRDACDPDFLIIARTDALGAEGGGVKEAIRRGNAYRRAGADMIYVEGPSSREEVRLFCMTIDAPILYSFSGDAPRLSTEELAAYGIAMVILPDCTAQVMNRSLFAFAKTLKEKGPAYEGKWLNLYGDDPMVDIRRIVDIPWAHARKENCPHGVEAEAREDADSGSCRGARRHRVGAAGSDLWEEGLKPQIEDA